MITIWTVEGSPLHCRLCDAFLDDGGFTLVRDSTDVDALYEVLTMEPRAAEGRTCWRLVAAVPEGMA